jgi:hypothetical protein
LINFLKRLQQRFNQEWQESPAGARQTDGKKLGFVWRIRKKISQIFKDYFYLPFFLLIILCMYILKFSQLHDWLKNVASCGKIIKYVGVRACTINIANIGLSAFAAIPLTLQPSHLFLREETHFSR